MMPGLDARQGAPGNARINTPIDSCSGLDEERGRGIVTEIGKRVAARLRGVTP